MEFNRVLFITLICLAKASQGSLSKPSLKSIPAVDALINRLENDQWSDDEACLGATLRILYGVKNDTLWATWVWDSMQPPVGVFYGNSLNLGHYDQCLKTPWSSQHELSTQYCLVDVKIQEPKKPREFGAFDSADEYLNTLSTSGRNLVNLNFGVCMPAVCSPSSIAKVFRHMLHLTHIPDVELVSVDSSDCQTAAEKPYPGRFYAFLSFLGILLGIVVFSTIYSHFNESTETSGVDAITKSFCIVRNWNDLFKVSSAEIRVLHGIRFLTAFLVVGYHQGFLSVHNPGLLINKLDLDKLMKTEIGQGIAHIDLIVDTFFLISGLLLVKGLLSGKQRNLLTVLLKRYFRLMGPLAVITFYILCMARHTSSGPIWLRGNSYEDGICEEHWWKNFFMMNNDIKTICFGLGWYVSCDYHLAILTVSLYWIYKRSRRNGVIAFVAISCAVTVRLAVISYTKWLPLGLFSNLSEVENIRDYEIMNECYIKWHDRAGSYLVGAVMGWLLTIYKPADHRNIISKTTSFIIVLTSVYVMLKVTTVNHWLSGGSRVEVAIAIATNRVVWAIAVSAVIGACEYGSVPVIRDTLGSAFFVPLSKLSYGIYITHFFILQRNLHTVRTPYVFDIYSMIISILGTTVLSTMVSLALYVLVEAPCTNISNFYFAERNTKAELHSTGAENGSIYQNGKTKLKHA